MHVLCSICSHLNIIPAINAAIERVSKEGCRCILTASTGAHVGHKTQLGLYKRMRSELSDTIKDHRDQLVVMDAASVEKINYKTKVVHTL